jgi:hypothetical protein
MHDHHQLDAEVAAHDASVSERKRLSGRGNLERVRTWELLARHLPPAPAVVVGTSVEPPASTPCRCRAWLPGPLRGFLDEPGFEAIVERESEPSLLGTSAHLLAVANRSG